MTASGSGSLMRLWSGIGEDATIWRFDGQEDGLPRWRPPTAAVSHLGTQWMLAGGLGLSLDGQPEGPSPMAAGFTPSA